MQSAVSISARMVRAVLLILVCVQLSLVKGLDSNPVKVENETAINSTRRILFGKPANPSNFPYMVRLRLNAKGDRCGGSIIANHWVLTACHCTRPFPCNGIEIFPGVWSNRESVYAANCYYHEMYRPGTFEYDISLLRVDPDILRDGRAGKVPLPSPGTRFPPGTPATLVGWGKTEQNVYPWDLLYANVVLEKWDNCNAQNGIVFAEIPIRTVCTLGLGLAPSSDCFGDSGGPLLVNGVTIGVFSNLLHDREGKCIPGSPSMFTSVVDYLPWIFNIVDPSVDTSSFPVLPEHNVK